jgi:hypothetical protein
MISRNGSGFEYGSAHPWSDDRTTTQYEPAQLHYLQRTTHARSVPPPPPPPRTHALEPASEVAASQLSFFEITERTENPFVRAHADAKAGAWIVAATIALVGAVLFTRVLLYAANGSELVAPTHAAAIAVLPPMAANAGPTSMPAGEPASALPMAAAAAAAGAGQHKSPAKHVAAHASASSLESSVASPAVIAHMETPEPAPSVTGFATLRLNSRPWSQVFVDGRFLGNTPQLGLRLPAGRHTLRLVNPEFNMTKTITVELSAGENLSRVETLQD